MHFLFTLQTTNMSAFRTDIQALRAIAVLLVLAFHVWPSHITGGYIGVDVFFVISGYLITGHLLREVASTGRIDLPVFYARRARRLLPAASLTLAAVGIASYLWMPALTWTTVAADMVTSTLYAENWALVRRSVDYGAQGQTPSPLQHFWSLAVEEQFYLGWPLLVAGVTAARRRRLGAKPTALPGMAPPLPPLRTYALPMGMLCAFSFLSSLYYARTSPASGYFMTHTRLHELGLGGLLGVWAVRVPAKTHAGSKLGVPVTYLASQWPRTLSAAAGLVAIGSSGFLFTPRLPFPGSSALVPVLGAVAVISAGEGVDNTHALAPILAHPWLQYVGDISYSLYLAHWPVVVVYPFITGRAVDDSFADGVTVMLVSWAIAHECKRGWEDRFRTRSKSADDQESRPVLLRTSWWLVAGFTLGSILSAAILLQAKKHASMSTRFDVAHEIGDNRVCIGSTNTSLHNTLYLDAEAVVKDAVHTDATPFCQVPLSKVLPSIDGARKEGISFEQSCYHDFGTQLRFCDGDGNITDHSKMYQADSQSGHGSPVSVSKKTSPLILLLGDSHVMNWLPAFAEVRRRRGWTLTGLSRRSCLASPVTKKYKELFPRDGGSSVPCRTWLANAVAFIADQKPTAVFLTSVTKYQHYHQAFGNGAEDALKEATKHVERTIAEIRAAGIDVLAMKESPDIEDDVPTCLASAVQRLGEGNAIAACTRQAADCLQDGPLNRAAKNMKIKMLSFDDAFCSVDGICPPIIGNVLAYRDQHHLTKTFAKTLAPALERRILAALPYL